MFEKIFNEYVSKYDFSNKKIVGKFNHSYRVRTLSLKYARLLSFSNRDTEIAEFIGLYHDIGRFYQITEYGTFKDFESVDHGSVAVKILFDEGLINNFDFNEEEKEIIKYAILMHNKYELEYTDDERKIMHAKLIRDTDKLDILFIDAYLRDIRSRIISEPLSNEVIKEFKEHKLFRDLDINNLGIIRTFGFSFDVNNDECIEEYRTYLIKYYQMLDDKDEIFKVIYDEVIDYLDRRCKKYVRN